MDPEHIIDGHPSIRVTVSFGHKHGWLALSSLYGSYKVASEYEIPIDEIVHIFCPHCHAELIGGGRCSDCGAPMVPMIVRGGGVVQICARSRLSGPHAGLGWRSTGLSFEMKNFAERGVAVSRLSSVTEFIEFCRRIQDEQQDAEVR